MYQRSLKPLLSNSFFLFGSRGTGKSTLLRQLFVETKRPHLYYDLLDETVLGRLSQDAESVFLGDLKKLDLSPPHTRGWIVLDEVQRSPTLLNTVHRLIENQRLCFALTGSSARKLKRGGANLLAGRAFVYHLYPLTHQELGSRFDLNTALTWGTLPAIAGMGSGLHTDEERTEYLRAYVNTYLKEEIKEEQIVRKIDPFRRFLDVAAQTSGTILNYSKLARDALSDDASVKRYFEILEDTLLGVRLDPFHPSLRKRESSKPKFYLFDTGVQRAITRRLQVPLVPGTSAYGEAFEAFILWECIRQAEYQRTDFRFSYLRTKDDVELDLIIERPGKTTIALEIKSSTQLDPTGFSHQSALAQDLSKQLQSKTGGVEALIAYRGRHAQQIGAFSAMPWEQAIERIFA